MADAFPSVISEAAHPSLEDTYAHLNMAPDWQSPEVRASALFVRGSRGPVRTPKCPLTGHGGSTTVVIIVWSAIVCVRSSMFIVDIVGECRWSFSV